MGSTLIYLWDQNWYRGDIMKLSVYFSWFFIFSTYFFDRRNPGESLWVLHARHIDPYVNSSDSYEGICFGIWFIGRWPKALFGLLSTLKNGLYEIHLKSGEINALPIVKEARSRFLDLIFPREKQRKSHRFTLQRIASLFLIKMGNGFALQH